MKTYRGARPRRVWVEDGKTGQSYPLEHIVVHSPTGFEWGYGGSGPADLALAILADHFGEVAVLRKWERRGRIHTPGLLRCEELYHHFKWDVIAGLTDEWTLTTTVIQAWVEVKTQRDPKVSA